MNYLQKTFDVPDYDLYDPILKIKYKIKDETRFWPEANLLPGHFERNIKNDYINYMLIVDMKPNCSGVNLFNYINRAFFCSELFRFNLLKDFSLCEYLYWKNDDFQYIFYVPNVQFHFRDIETMNMYIQRYFNEINSKIDNQARGVKFMHRGMRFPLNLHAHPTNYKLLNDISRDDDICKRSFSLDSFCQSIPVVLNGKPLFELIPDPPANDYNLPDSYWEEYFKTEERINESNVEKFYNYLPFVMIFQYGDCFLLES